MCRRPLTSLNTVGSDATSCNVGRMSRQTRNVWFLWLSLALALAVRLLFLTDKSVWIDEAHRITWAKGQEMAHFFDLLPHEANIRAAPSDLRSALRVTARRYPPLYTFFYNPWMRVFGDSDESLRLLAVLFGVLAVVVTWFLARSLFSERAASWAAMLAALAPFQIQYSQEIGQYSLATLFVLLVMLFATRYAEHQRAVDGAAWAATAIGAFYAHYSTVMMVAATGLATTLAWGDAIMRRPSGQPLGLALAKAALRLGWPVTVMLAGVLASLDTVRASMREVTFDRHAAVLNEVGSQLARGFSTWLLGEASVSSSRVLIVAALAFGLWLVWLGTQSASRLPKLYAAALAVLPVALLLAAVLVTRNEQLMWPRYFVLMCAGLPVFGGAALAQLSAGPRAAAAVALLAGMALGLHSYYTTPIKRPWREVASTIEREADVSESVLVHLPNLVFPLAWYMKSDLRVFGINGEHTLEHEFAVATDARPGVWLVLAWAEQSPATTWLSRQLGCRYEVAQHYPFWSVELTHYTQLRTDNLCEARGSFAAQGDCVIDAASTELEISGRLSSAIEPGDNWALALGGARSGVPQFQTDKQSFVATVALHNTVPGSWVTLELQSAGVPVLQERCLVRPPPTVVPRTDGRALLARRTVEFL
jgi:uncharacterized membrane protein